MTVMPEVTEHCWPVDESACEEFSSYEGPIKDIAISLAGSSMLVLTNYQVGGCPGTLRPCSVGCAAGSPSWSWSNGTFYPLNIAGTWVNMTCGCGWACEHEGVEGVRLPGWVSSVQEVKVDGIVIPDTDYRVDNHNELVRLDGEKWPTRQNMGLADTEVGTFAVTYTTGIPVDATGAYAAGILACEFAKALKGQACDFPKSVTSIVRQGVTIVKAPGVFPKGLTGNLIVDAYTLRYNPFRQSMPSAVWSPDTGSGRVTTWVAP